MSDQNSFEQILKKSILNNEVILETLNDLLKEMKKVHLKANIAKTVGTSTSALGTVVTIGSIIAAPFTGGASLLIGLSGAILSVGGGVTNIITDVVESRISNKTIEKLKTIVGNKTEFDRLLKSMIDNFGEIVERLTSEGISQESAIEATLTAIVNGQLDLMERSHNKVLFTALSATAKIKHFQLLGHKGIQFLAMSSGNMRFIASFFNLSTKTMYTMGKAFPIASAVITVIDLGILIRDWTTDPPTTEAIKNLTEQIEEELLHFRSVQQILTSLTMASKGTISKKKSNSIILSSNYRYVDTSCKIFSDSNTVYFQCLTCDESRISYICIECIINGNHQGHYLIEIDDIADIVFCDCGDFNGIYFCEKHIRCEYPDNDKPLYRNEEYLRSVIFDLDMEEIKCGRINQIRAVNMDSFEGKLINNYFYNTNAHNFKDLKLIECRSVYRKDQETRFLEKEFDKTRCILLWHGTKGENIGGILKSGFRKPNRDDVINGAMFGRGIYFADRSSKSIQYCEKEGYGTLLLCEVSVGAMYRTGLSNHYKEIPENYNSIKGLGKRCPNTEGEQKLGNIIVPCGTTIDSPEVNISELKYNEYILFDPDRVLIRYVVAFKVDNSG